MGDKKLLENGLMGSLANFMVEEVAEKAQILPNVGVYSSFPEYEDFVLGFRNLVQEGLRKKLEDGSVRVPEVIIANFGDKGYSFDVGYYLKKGTMPATV